MFTNEDLNFAVEKGIFTDSSVGEFRTLLSSLNNSPSVDEENFRLVRGFNDIFVVIACSLLFISSMWVSYSITYNNRLGFLTLTILSWVLAEYFVRKRRMALPAIGLLLSFVGGVFGLSMSFFWPSDSELMWLIATSILTLLAASFHWLRFKVPITIAAGTAAAGMLFVTLTLYLLPQAGEWHLAIIFLFGLMSFAFAMYWDSSDKERTTRNADVAFWLHLLSAPLIIHPVFSNLEVLNGNESLVATATIIVLYLLMTSISIVIDRRVFMVSALLYVLYALSNLINIAGGSGSGLALPGIFIGSALLLLSAYWQRVRAQLVGRLPNQITKYIPNVIVG